MLMFYWILRRQHSSDEIFKMKQISQSEMIFQGML